MLKWTIGLLAVLMAVGIGFGVYVYVERNDEADSAQAAEERERTAERRIKQACSSFLDGYKYKGDINDDAQYDAACTCFADNMFEKMRDVPEEEIDAFLGSPENNEKAQVILVKCADQAGLN